MLNNTKIRSTLAGWTESLVITILFVIISTILNNPLSLESPFPWIWFAPVLIALRYGLWPALFSIIILVVTSLYKDQTQIEAINYQLYILGGFLLTIICGVFQNRWSKKINYNEEISRYLQKRIQSTAEAYKTLLLAFHHLEQSYITKPVTIRGAVGDLRQLLATADEALPKDIFINLLNILAQNCFFEIAAIFPVEKNIVQINPVASIGKITKPKQDDFLIEEALTVKAMTHVSHKEILKGHLSAYLIVAPLMDQESNVYALLAIQEIPFLKLNDENLETINILLQYFNEGKTVKNADLILKKFPDCNVDFANELQRLSFLQKNTKLDSSVVALIFYKNPQQNQYLFRLRQEKRGIDTLWETAKGDIKILFILMPFSNLTAIENYVIRINTILAKEFNLTLKSKELGFESRLISSYQNPVDLIEELINIK